MSDAHNSDPMPLDAVEQAVEAIRRRITDAETRCAELQKRIAVDREEERLLTRLLSLRRGELVQNNEATAPSPRVPNDSPARPADAVLQAVVAELTSAGRPLHISDLMRLLALRRIDIPGAGTQANLITYLRRDPRFIRSSRGMYALKEWGIDAMPPARRRKRRKRIRSRTSQ
jgi:hypothetical protein